MRGCLVLLLTVIGTLAAGLLVGGGSYLIAEDSDAAIKIGMSTGFLALILLGTYLSLWFSSPDDLAPRFSNSTLASWRDAKAESKLQSAELRIGCVFAAIGSITAASLNGSNIVVAGVTIALAILGGAVGYDLKRRVNLVRQKIPPRSEYSDFI